MEAMNPPFASCNKSKRGYVGWSQLFQGRLLVKDWGQLQEDFIDKNINTLKLDRRYYSGAIWARKLVTLLWKIMRAQWYHRNADRHGRTKAANHQIRHKRLLQSITAQCAEAPNILAAGRALFEQPIRQKLLQHPNRLELWLKRTKPIVKLSKHDAEATNRQTHSQLSKYFRRKRKKNASNPELESLELTRHNHYIRPPQRTTPITRVAATGATCPFPQ
jgi:hypothetical protein